MLIDQFLVLNNYFQCFCMSNASVDGFSEQDETKTIPGPFLLSSPFLRSILYSFSWALHSGRQMGMKVVAGWETRDPIIFCFLADF